MIKNTLLCAAAICASAVLVSSGAAQANPATPMPPIESSAAQLCGAINVNPTDGGVMGGALVIITAIHHVCPQHEGLLMGVVDPIAAEELCAKPM